MSDTPPPCPFCGKVVDLDDPDTLYPSGTGWKQESDLRTYHSFRDVPEEQRCWGMHCPTPSGGCGAEMYGDSREEALAKWSRRTPSAEAEEAPPGLKDLASEIAAYFKTDAGEASLHDPVYNPYLRNRIEAAFIAGWDARCRYVKVADQ